jgi:hypothetical protein
MAAVCGRWDQLILLKDLRRSLYASIGVKSNGSPVTRAAECARRRRR